MDMQTMTRAFVYSQVSTLHISVPSDSQSSPVISSDYSPRSIVVLCEQQCQWVASE